MINVYIKRDYIGMFDVLKGHIMFFIILVQSIQWVFAISLQTSTNLTDLEYISNFSIVPMCILFLLIGYTFKPMENLKGHFTKAARIYLIPYSVTAISIIAIYVLYSIVSGQRGLGIISAPILGYILGYAESVQLGGRIWVTGINLWFLNATFIGVCIYNLSFKIKNNYIRVLIIFAVSIIASLLPSQYYYVDTYQAFLPWSIQASLLVPALFEIGHQLHTTKFFYKKYNRLFEIAISLFVFLAWLYAKAHFHSDIGANVYTYGYIDVIIGVLFSILLIKIFIKLNVPFWKITLPAEFVGRYSLWVFSARAVQRSLTELLTPEIETCILGLFNSSVSPIIIIICMYAVNIITVSIVFFIIYNLGNLNFKFMLRKIRK